VDEAQNQAAAAYHAAAGQDLEKGAEWVRPVSTFDAYPAGAKVPLGHLLWKNTGSGIAIGEPSVDPAWMNITPEEESPDMEASE